MLGRRCLVAVAWSPQSPEFGIGLLLMLNEIVTE